MWTFEQKTGSFSHDGEFVAKGYAGHGVGVDNPDLENEVGVGPVPRGVYTIGPAFTHPQCGPVSMRLEPDAANEMFGRSGFLIHGDSIAHPGTASDGCIVLAHDVRANVSESPDRQLQVVE